MLHHEVQPPGEWGHHSPVPATGAGAGGSGRRPAAICRHVTKSFGTTTALAGLDLDVPAGVVTALLGPNGAGKTTTISLLAGLRQPDSGTVEVLGGPPRALSIQRRVGLAPQVISFPAQLRVAEVLDFVAAHHAHPLPAGETLERFQLATLAQRRSDTLSGGEQRRLAAAIAILGRPALLILDEPTANLDPPSRQLLWREIRRQRSDGVAVLLCTHDLDEAEQLAEEVVVLAHGRCSVSGTPAALRRRTGAASLAAALAALEVWS